MSPVRLNVTKIVGNIMLDESDGDDSMSRWLSANGIVRIVPSDTKDGKMRWFRADGSEVISEDSYPYWAALTPYTEVKGEG